MSKTANTFRKQAEEKAFDNKHRTTIRFNMGRYHNAFQKGLLQYNDLDKARRIASNIKRKALNNLDRYLIDFEQHFTEAGGKVIWAVDAKEAQQALLKICKRHAAKTVVKSKSMTTEELHVNEVLEEAGIESLETDLGEYIVQVAGEKPYHIVTPAMHKSKEDIAALFHEKWGWDINSTPEEMTHMVREKIREKFYRADVGITGANFLIADTGAIALTENEGNAMMSFGMPKVHIAIVGIEKMIPSINDLHWMWPILSTHGTGQHVTVYNSIVRGPAARHEADGPQYAYVILLDNKRSKLLEQDKQSVALSCIRCGACLNACPVYHNIGGHTYATTYSGPIGSVISPWLMDFKNYKHLSFASSLCGACGDVCPVKIPLPELLLYNRRDAVEKNMSPMSEKLFVKAWETAMLHPKWLDVVGGGVKNWAASLFFAKQWGKKRALPKIAATSFRKQWLEQNKEK